MTNYIDLLVEHDKLQQENEALKAHIMRQNIPLVSLSKIGGELGEQVDHLLSQTPQQSLQLIQAKTIRTLLNKWVEMPDHLKDEEDLFAWMIEQSQEFNQ